MKNCLWTVCVDNYAPSITRYSLPILEAYANKIGADFRVIQERKFPEVPAPYEKLQVFELGNQYEYNIIVDADLLIDPSAPDLTRRVPVGHLGYYMGFDASLLFQADPFFLRDGRRLGISTNFLIVHQWAHDALQPDPTPLEILARTKRQFIADEYTVSRNVARYGLKVTGLMGDGEAAAWIKHLDLTTVGPDSQRAEATARDFYLRWFGRPLENEENPNA
jgi:hypothetical protein